ncbi:permease [Bacillus cereus group sp. Bc005]|uniref:permease n=1 Tax=unclassified Bacillus cereus group TaxID=2750818 RepID=UPI0009785D05|nr:MULTISPECIES: permease [unclassified Bacillus cereus group]MDA2758628.1 permease [Bacillus cereus group sp. Bc007]MDA2764128.1 permease [Bacillus cereus group sp. Bc008]MDA2775258.1 permease [Bacillus cereus group sp. Bc005]ONG65614.1 permease [Bacillus cereus]
MLPNNKIYKHLFSLLIALNVGLAIIAVIQQKWRDVADTLGGATLLIAIVLVIDNGQVNKWSAMLFTITAIENGLEVANQFLLQNYLDSLWDIAAIILCVYWMRQYYVEE